jgi:FYVE zinc finger
MRLSLLNKNNSSCQCNNSKERNVASNQLDDMVNSSASEQHIIPFSSDPFFLFKTLSQHPVIDCNSENSTCSWEAIDEKNSAFPVLWVPDHAITRCQSCQIEFWLGRRKHHCRSCGQIFCGDCSQYFAPFPKESFLEPVRLCESCFQQQHGPVPDPDCQLIAQK